MKAGNPEAITANLAERKVPSQPPQQNTVRNHNAGHAGDRDRGKEAGSPPAVGSSRSRQLE
jgi:hypothetical protein